MIQSWKTRALHDHGKALSDLPIRIGRDFLLAPVDHVTALSDSFIKSAGTYRNNVSFTSFSKALENLKHVAFFNVVLQNHVLVIDSELVRKFCHSHHQTVSSLRGSVALVGSCRRCVGVVDLKVIAHVIALKERKGL